MTATPVLVIGGQAVMVAVMMVIGLLLRRWEPMALALVVLPLPWLVLEQKVNRRVTAIEAQTDVWLGALANALRASPSLGEALSSTVSVTEAPLSEELETLMKDYELGTPLDEALTNLGQRCRSQVMDACLQALRVAKKSGGNLTETLESAAAALRELARLEGVVRTKTAEGKMQAVVIGFIPLPLVSAINWIDPTFLAPLWNTFYGNLLLAIAGFFWLTAIVLAKKICAVDV
jgi:tight adherence protein B